MDFLINSSRIGIAAAVCHSLQWALTRYCNIKVSSPRHPGPWTRPFCGNYKSLAASAWHNSQICLIRFACLSIRGRPINHICEDMGMIFCETKVYYCTKNTLCAVFLHSCSHAKLQNRLGYSLSKSLNSVLSAFLLFHLVTKGTLAENSLDWRLAKLATTATSRARDTSVTSMAEYI